MDFKSIKVGDSVIVRTLFRTLYKEEVTRLTKTMIVDELLKRSGVK